MCRGKEVSRAKVILVSFFDNRADTISKVLARVRLVSIGILPKCQFHENESGCKADDKCLFPHYKVEDQPSRKQKRSFQNGKRDDKDAVAIAKTVPQLGCVSLDSELLDSQRGKQAGKTRCKKSWDRFEKYGSLSLRCVKQVSGKRTDHRLDKYKSKILVSEVPTL